MNDALATLDPTSPNNWADPTARYVVEVRPPRIGEWYISGSKLVRCDAELRHVRCAVIVGIA